MGLVSKVTFAGPRYSSHDTLSPTKRSLLPAVLLRCARKRPSAVDVVAGASRGGATGLGLGSPSSVTIAVHVSGAATLAAATGARLITGGLFAFTSSPKSIVLLPLAIIMCS